MNASKINAGTFGADRIPSLDASKINAGTLNEARIPTLAQSKISGLSTSLASKVNTSTTINGQALTANVSLNTSDLIEKVTSLPTTGKEGQMVSYNGALYVYRET